MFSGPGIGWADTRCVPLRRQTGSQEEQRPRVQRKRRRQQTLITGFCKRSRPDTAEAAVLKSGDISDLLASLAPTVAGSPGEVLPTHQQVDPIDFTSLARTAKSPDVPLPTPSTFQAFKRAGFTPREMKGITTAQFSIMTSQMSPEDQRRAKEYRKRLSNRFHASKSKGVREAAKTKLHRLVDDILDWAEAMVGPTDPTVTAFRNQAAKLKLPDPETVGRRRRDSACESDATWLNL